MATQKPLIQQTWASEANSYSPSEPEYQDIIETPSQDKVQNGWEYGEKPSHKFFNYLWKRNTETLKIINDFGVLPWDQDTFYAANALVVFNGVLYISIIENNNEIPSNSSSWEIYNNKFEDLDDVTIVLNQGGTSWNCSDIIPCTDSGYCSQFILQYNSSTGQWESTLGAELEFPIINLLNIDNPSNSGVIKVVDDNWEIVDFDVKLDIHPEPLNSSKSSIQENKIPVLSKNLQYKNINLNNNNIKYKPQQISPGLCGYKCYKKNDKLFLNSSASKTYTAYELNNYYLWLDFNKEIYTDQTYKIFYRYNSSIIQTEIQNFYISKDDDFFKFYDNEIIEVHEIKGTI